jgi:hypothetical protein
LGRKKIKESSLKVFALRLFYIVVYAFLQWKNNKRRKKNDFQKRSKGAISNRVSLSNFERSTAASQNDRLEISTG